MQCSYCKAGLNKRKPLGSPRPQGELARKIESNVLDAKAQEMKEQASVDGSSSTYVGAEDQMWEFDDVLNCDFSGDFNLEDELNTL